MVRECPLWSKEVIPLYPAQCPLCANSGHLSAPRSSGSLRGSFLDLDGLGPWGPLGMVGLVASEGVFESRNLALDQVDAERCDIVPFAALGTFASSCRSGLKRGQFALEFGDHLFGVGDEAV